ncbi:MAG: MFS transporter [Suipraeoptans sp.]
MEHWKRKFAILGVGQAASMLTSSILQIAIVWYLTERTGSPVIITMSTLAGFLPRAIVGLFSGSIIDRFNRKKVLIFSDMGIALAALSLSLVAFFTEIPIWFIFIILAIRSVGAAFHSPSLNAITPSIVPKEELARCAGVLQGFESVSLILSPAIAGVLYNIWNLSFIVLLDVLGAGIAITLVFILDIPSNVIKKTKEKLNIWKDTKEGLNIIRKEKGMMMIMVISTLYAFIYFPIGSMYPLITMTYFGGSISDSSLVEIIFSSGTLVGALILGIIGKKLHKIKAIACSIGIYGIGALITGIQSPDGIRIFMACSVVMGLTIPFFHGLRTAIFQSRIADEYLGRVLSFAYSISMFSGPIGLLLGGSFSEILGVNRCFMVCGILAIILGVAMLFNIRPYNEAIKSN